MTHNYTCKKCFNRWVGFYRSDKPKCPKCKSKSFSRVACPQVQLNPITDSFLRKELGEGV